MGRQKPQPQDEVPSKLSAAQFDYAWNWFNFHAAQRTTMFNFMLIIFGFLAAAIAGTYEKTTILSVWLCAFGAVLAVIFSLLDKRNQQLVWLGEDILRRFEAEELYKGIMVSDRKTGKDIPGGPLWRQKLDDKKLENNSTIQNYLLGVWAGKHRYLLKTIALLFAAGFALMGAGLGFFYHQSATPICIGGV